MPQDDNGARDRAGTLGARIAAAQARIAARRRGEDVSVGAALGTLNDELDEMVYEDHDEAKRALNKIEARLRAEEIKLEDEEEERKREED
jgi:nucleotide-binding universal stress UspA family protein